MCTSTRFCLHHSITFLSGSLNLINLTLATTFIITPYWFHHAGLLVGVGSLSFCLALCGIASLWVLECLGRTSLLYANNGYSCLNGNDIASIDRDRTFELNEMSKIIMGKMCEFIISLVVIVTGILFIIGAVVAGSQALSVNIPINTTSLTTCNSSEFDATFLAEGNCLNWYRIVVVSFGIVGTVLSCLNIQKLIFALVSLCIFRFIIMGYMICFSIFALRDETKNYTIQTDFITSFEFDRGMLAAGSLFAFVGLPDMIPSLTHSIKSKSQIRSIVSFSCIICFVVLTIYGSTLAFAFGTDIHQNSFLNLKPFTEGNHSFPIKVMSHLILLYPCLDGLSGFIYGVILTSNQTFSMITRKDFSEVSKKTSYRMLNLLIYLCYSIFSTVTCLFVSNIATVMGIIGLGSFIANVIIPAFLQIASSRKCSQIFTNSLAANIESKPAFRKALSLLFKSSFPTPYSGCYSSYFMVLVLSAISTLIVLTSFYFIVVVLLS